MHRIGAGGDSFSVRSAVDSRNPESLLYSYPHGAAPCDGRAGTGKATRFFFETWMGGGLGRAQGGYDENGITARWCCETVPTSYDPLGP